MYECIDVMCRYIGVCVCLPVCEGMHTQLQREVHGGYGFAKQSLQISLNQIADKVLAQNITFLLLCERLYCGWIGSFM